MKIQVFDSWNGKFSSSIVEHWRSLGHEVSFNGQYEVPADITFFYQADNCAVEGVPKVLAPKIFVQCVDIEVWVGQATAVPWEKVTGGLFMAKHIMEYVTPKLKSLPHATKLIKPGIDLSKWTLAPQERFNAPVRRIAYVVGDRRIWDVKRLDIAFQILKDVQKMKPQYIWQLHIRGSYSTHEQYNRYCQYLEENLKLKDFIVWYPDRIEDLNKWLDDKHYFLLPSTKEAFSYATAETMAKGIKPILNNWEGSKETWGEFASDTYLGMLEKLCEDTYEPERYRRHIEENYNQNRYFRELDEFILGGE